MSQFNTDQILDMIEAHGGPQGLDLSGKDLSGIDLSFSVIGKKRQDRGWPRNGQEAPWSFILFEWDRPEANTVGANLQGANLSQADLQKVKLAGANLQNANLAGANLQNASIVGAYLQRADLTGANLQGVELYYDPDFPIRPNLEGARLSGANLQGAYLYSAQMVGAHLSRANLQGADLYEANLRWADLREANLQGAYLYSAQMVGAHLSRANLQGADLREAVLDGAYFGDVRLDDTLIDRQKLGKAVAEEKDKKWQAAKGVYRELKVNWRNQGQYDDARWAYLKERRMERKAIQKEWWQAVQDLWAWACRLASWPVSQKPVGRPRLARLPALSVVIAFNRGNDVFWDYGESPWWVALWLALLVMGFFPLLYLAFGSLTTTHWYDYWLFSVRTSVTLVFTEMGQTQGEAAKFVTAVEGLLGMAGYAAFIYTLGRRAAGY